MKKILSILLIVVMVIGLTGCGNKEKLKTYNLGDTVSTDIIDFTLNDSQLTIALSSTINEDFGIPVENYKDIGYDKFIAPTGKTLVYAEFTISNNDRSQAINLEPAGIVDYKGNTSEMKFTASNWEIKKSYSEREIEKGKWVRDESVNRIIYALEKGKFRAYGKIAGELNELKGTYYYSIELPNSKGDKEKFTYIIDINS